MEKIFYIAHILDTLNTFLIIFWVVAMLAFAVFFVEMIIEYDSYGKNSDDFKLYQKGTLWSLLAGIILGCGTIVTPDKDTYLLMMGGRVVDYTVNHNPEIKEIPENTISLVNEYLKTVTNELKGEHSDETSAAVSE